MKIRGNLVRIAIIDDESSWREIIETLIKSHSFYNDAVVDVYKKGIDYLHSKKVYDVTFVDVEMPGIDGFETIKLAREYNAEGKFVILTTHSEMSRRGYIVNAFRYIYKSKIAEELKETLDSIMEIWDGDDFIHISVVGGGENKYRKIFLKDIIYVEACRHNVTVYINGESIRTRESISRLENLLVDERFCRCHKSFIINLDGITQLERGVLVMSNGGNVEVSKRNLSYFRNAYSKRKFKKANA